VGYTDTIDVVRRLITLGIVAAAVLSGACAARGGVPRPFPGATLPPGAVDPSPQPPPTGLPTPATAGPPALVSTALQFQGVPYRNGGSDPSGFDCSGFVQYVFAKFGTALPREVRDQFQAGTSIDLDEVQAGDLLFFETVSRGASHVGMAVGGGEFVHAPSSRGVVRVERYDGSYWARRFVGARRVVVVPERGRGGLPGASNASD
jgi:cell wall-associated NlpC family hydrolase